MLSKLITSIKKLHKPENYILSDIRTAYNLKDLATLQRLSRQWTTLVKQKISKIDYDKNGSNECVSQMADILSEALVTSWIAHFKHHGFNAKPSIILQHATNIVGLFNVETQNTPLVPWLAEHEGTNIRASYQAVGTYKIASMTTMEYIPLLVSLYSDYEKIYELEPTLKHVISRFINNYNAYTLFSGYINKHTAAQLYLDYIDYGSLDYEPTSFKSSIFSYRYLSDQVTRPNTETDLISMILRDKNIAENMTTPYFLYLLIDSDNITNQYKLLAFLNAASIHAIPSIANANSTSKIDILSASGLLPQLSTIYTVNPNQIDMETAIDKLIMLFDPEIVQTYVLYKSLGLSIIDSLKAVHENHNIIPNSEPLPELY